MPFGGRAGRVLPVLLMLLALAGCRGRYGSVGRVDRVREPAPALQATPDEILREVRQEFACGGEPIHPGLVYEFIPWFTDNGPVVTAVEVFPSREPTRYSYATVRLRAGWTECSVKSLLPQCWENGTTTNEPMFGYRRLGVLSDGTHVLRTYYCSGGSGNFHDLVFIRVEAEQAYDSRMMPRTRVAMRALCVYSLGDRDDGEIRVLPDRVIVGPSKYREKEVVLKLN